jgi:RNA polymerase sigma-70 factor (ECF subfamily)
MNNVAPVIPTRPAHPPDAGEADLLARLRAGQADAFAELMRRYNRLLFRAARGIVGDDAEAQDAVQEGYLRAFLALATFRGEASLATWLTRIVINQALGQQRKLGRLVYWDEDLAHQEENAMSPQSSHRTAPADDLTPEEAASRNELRRELEAAIDLLPPIYRCVFILRAVQGLDVEDTAATLQVSQDVVKTRYLRARGMLRRELDSHAAVPLASVHDFLGPRCDDMVSQVLARLRAAGVIRDQ